MKKKIKKKVPHPKYGVTKIITTSKKELFVNSCLGDIFYLSADADTHTAWTGSSRHKAVTGKVETMVKKFSGIEEV